MSSYVRVSRLRSFWDGDTFRCDVDVWPKLFGYNVPIRIAGIDCPERNSLEPGESAAALISRSYTRKMLLNAKSIRLCDCHRGKYFRVVATVIVDGQNLGDLLVAEGLAIKSYR